MIKRGRWIAIPRLERVCVACGNRIVESELYVLVICHAFNNLREVILSQLDYYLTIENRLDLLKILL